MTLAPLRGVTIHAFRETFAQPLAEAGFDEAVTPFIPALHGFNPLKDRELRPTKLALRITPQFIGKDPEALRECLMRTRDAGFATADLNCGCPFPMVRNKGRGSGLLKTPDTLFRLLEVGCEVLGAGNFSMKTRLGVESPDELEKLIPRINQFPLRQVTVHGRVARQMYEGTCDHVRLAEIKDLLRVPFVPNGDLDWRAGEGMVGRSFIRDLGQRADIGEYLLRYLDLSRTELAGDRPVLGRMKELLAYWKDQKTWQKRWNIIKICRTVDELRQILV